MRNDYLAHHGVKGMKWGVRRSPEQLGHPKMKPSSSDTKVTQEAKRDHAKLSEGDFRRKYQVSKKAYAKRVAKSPTGDPYREAKERMNGSKAGKRMFDASVKKEADLRTSIKLANKADKVNSQRSTGSKIATELFLGSRGNQAYNTLRASGHSKAGSAAVMALFGTEGGMMYADKKYQNSKAGKRSKQAELKKYYED